MRQQIRKFTATEVRGLLTLARDRPNMADLWKSFCEHAVHEENAHAKRDNITPTVQPVVFNTGDESDSDASDYDSEAEELAEAQQKSSTTAQFQYDDDVSNCICMEYVYVIYYT